MEALGLTWAEGKLILPKIQEGVVQEQIQDALGRRRHGPDCSKAPTARAITTLPCALGLGTLISLPLSHRASQWALEQAARRGAMNRWMSTFLSSR